MIIDNPRKEDIQDLRMLWKQAFGDTDAFLDSFFACGFSYHRCRCVFVEDKVVAALYWFDAEVYDKKMAYLYAIATEDAHRGQGLCHMLMADTHAHLICQGYTAALLKPAGESLQKFYGAMGYAPFGQMCEQTFQAGPKCYTRQIETQEYALLRREMLPPGGVRQEGALLRFLATQADMYAGEDFLAAVSKEEPARIVEFLGNKVQIPGLLMALGVKEAIVRTPGSGTVAGMYLPLTADAPDSPAYLGLTMG